MSLTCRGTFFLTNVLERVYFWSMNIPMITRKKESKRFSAVMHGLNSALETCVKAFGYQPLGYEDINHACMMLKEWYLEIAKIVDKKIGMLMKLVEDAGVDCVKIVTADHGQEFLEHGFLGHCMHLYNELIKVPLAILDENGHGVVSKPVTTRDLPKTLMDMLNLSDKDAHGLSGRSIFEYMNADKDRIVASETSESSATDKIVVIEKKRLLWEKRKISIVKGTWKYIYDYSNNYEELYNLSADPSEKNNIVDEHKDILKTMREICEYYDNRVRKSAIRYRLKDLQKM